ncbi:MAG: PEGA domain-containing protein [Candidatus Aminicenantes bacterium]|nr:PEGA domain-containing protein [Candidatus Aminicenantes bacterium]
MRIKVLALLVTCVFFFQHCATIIRGTSQEIPVTSNPSGAKIIVDGEEKGYVPVILKLKKKKSHIIQIKKEGYNTVEILTTRKTPIGVHFLGNLLLGASMAFGNIMLFANLDTNDKISEELAVGGMISGGILMLIFPFAVDFRSGAVSELSPKQLNVTLSKIEEMPISNFVFIDAEEFQNIKWIRVKCADSEGEEIVNLD